MENKVNIEITNCTECVFHSIQSDPDPNDWFCDDDLKNVCTKCNKCITVACRPHHIKIESKIPDWCPLIKK